MVSSRPFCCLPACSSPALVTLDGEHFCGACYGQGYKMYYLRVIQPRITAGISFEMTPVNHGREPKEEEDVDAILSQETDCD